MNALTLFAFLTLLLPACSGVSDGAESSESTPGVLELGLKTTLDGIRYQLDATFVVSGPESATLEARPGEVILSRELAAGSYSVALKPGYQVYQDQAVVLTPIDAELLSNASQSFETAASATTRVSYRFRISAGTLSFGG